MNRSAAPAAPEPGDTMHGPRAPFPAPGLSPTPAGALLDDAVRLYGANHALDFLGRRTSYAELGALTDRAAAGLQKLGVTKGVHVGLCLPNTPYAVIMYFAVLKAGGTVVNFNPLYTALEIEALAKAARVSIIASLDAAPIQDKIGPLAAGGLFKRVVICRLAAALPWAKSLALRTLGRKGLGRVPDHAPYVEFSRLISCAARPAPVAIDPARDIAVLQFTGGTTGTPKTAALTHANVTANVRQIMQAMPPIQLGGERMLAVLPFFHVFAMTGLMNFGLSIGAELLLMPKPDIRQMAGIIKRRRPTVLLGVPTLLTALCATASSPGGPDLTCIKFCVSGGAPLAPELMQRFERLAACRVLEGYGLSEAAPVVTLSPVSPVKPGSAGAALPGTIITIHDPENPARTLPQGETGEICVSGPQVMAGYFNQPEETANVFTPDGALRTGDLGYLDADGWLFIVDRIKDIILCSGFNVYPRMIEDAAHEHPAIQDAAAIGVPDPYRGQSPRLYVTLRPGARATEAEILDFLSPRLNKIEMPREIIIRGHLPKTMVGKLDKKALAREEAV